MEGGRLAETARGEVEAVAFGIGGGVGSYAHELLQVEEESDGGVGDGAVGIGDVGYESVDEIIEGSVRLAVAQYGGKEVADKEDDGTGYGVVEHHDACRHDVAHRLEGAVFAYVEDAGEGGAGEHQCAATAGGGGITVVDDDRDTAGLAREAVDDGAGIVVFD